VVLTSHWSFPTLANTSFKTGMHLSVVGSFEAVSETMSTAAFSLEPLLLIVARVGDWDGVGGAVLRRRSWQL
jgi:hypothetical protein